MTASTRRERGKADTDREIRQEARALLVNEGSEAVTLRAIARKVGITAPALYRYYTSREDLIEHIRVDICTDLADELNADLEQLAEGDVLGQVLAICRGFRRWAIAHPQEFSLVFASPVEPAALQDGAVHILVPTTDPFGRVFLAVAGKVLTTMSLIALPDDTVPIELLTDLEHFRASLLATIADAGFEVTDDLIGVGTAYAILKFWVRLYGQVALEVFGRFPFAVAKPEPLFEALLADLISQVGLT
jgi:AcrR family transcriptional regulator